jgi:hypothetical protein
MWEGQVPVQEDFARLFDCLRALGWLIAASGTGDREGLLFR